MGAAEAGRVLIVDFDPVRAAATAAALPTSFTVDFADCGSKALTLRGASTRTRAFLIERDLPDMDGFLLARRLRGAHEEACTVVLSARRGELLPASLQEHCDAYFAEADGRSRGAVAGLALSLLGL